MSKEILLVVESVSLEKSVPKDVIFEAIEAALIFPGRTSHYIVPTVTPGGWCVHGRRAA